ncbi:MAG: deoxyribose-phosphate aldolase [Planctomycetes bacterium]|nr:deoxyribose-phosphate aldolase [Planctomycetota bacterium]
MLFDRLELAQMMDFSAVRAESDFSDIKRMADAARVHQPTAVFALPAWTPVLRDLLKDQPDITIGGVVGFPSGGDTTESKVFQARQLLTMGCQELDMVINIGKVRSDLFEAVEQDICAVVQAAGETPVKVIFECGHLSDDQIRAASHASERAGARFVKTGTGWADTSNIAHAISLMHDCVGDRLGVKAAGGVRDLETLVDLYERGARRFGVGVDSAIKILQQCDTTFSH